MDALNSLGASFIDAEDQDRQASFAIASVAVFEPPAPAYEEFLTAIARRLPLVPLYRKKLRKVPLGLGSPVWVDDPHFDLRYHIRHTALPTPGGEEQLRRMVARVMAQRLDRDYPLWEYWLIEGLDQDRWALLSKVHHCMVDGVSGTDLYRVLFDAAPEPVTGPAAGPAAGDEHQPGADGSRPGGEPSDLRLALRAAAGALLLPVRDGGALYRAVSRPNATFRQAATALRGVAKMAGALPPAPRSSLSGPIGRQRRYTWARASLSDVKAIKSELGGTVNDVFLAAIAHGFRSLLLARGEEPAAGTVPTLIPVSVRQPGQESMYDNRLTALVADLPVEMADPIERLAAVTSRIADLKASSEGSAGEALVALGSLTPRPLATMFVRLAFSLPQREIVTVTTSVPGPRQPLYAMGRHLVEIIPYVPIATTLRTGVSIFTYCGSVTFGITGDYDSTPDLEVLARGIEDGISELLAATGNGAPPQTAAS